MKNAVVMCMLCATTLLCASPSLARGGSGKPEIGAWGFDLAGMLALVTLELALQRGRLLTRAVGFAHPAILGGPGRPLHTTGASMRTTWRAEKQAS